MLNGRNLTTKLYVCGDYEVENKDGEITQTSSPLHPVIKPIQQLFQPLNITIMGLRLWFKW